MKNYRNSSTRLGALIVVTSQATITPAQIRALDTSHELRRGHPNEDIDEIGLSDLMAEQQKPFPDVCAHPECEKTPIVGVNKRFVCEDHVDWVMKPIGEVVRLVRDTFR